MAYKEIIAAGDLALPLIFEELRDRGGHWYMALRLITGENPMPQEARGRFKLMRAVWLARGEDKGSKRLL